MLECTRLLGIRIRTRLRLGRVGQADRAGGEGLGADRAGPDEVGRADRWACCLCSDRKLD